MKNHLKDSKEEKQYLLDRKLTDDSDLDKVNIKIYKIPNKLHECHKKLK